MFLFFCNFLLFFLRFLPPLAGFLPLVRFPPLARLVVLLVFSVFHHHLHHYRSVLGVVSCQLVIFLTSFESALMLYFSHLHPLLFPHLQLFQLSSNYYYYYTNPTSFSMVLCTKAWVYYSLFSWLKFSRDWRVIPYSLFYMKSKKGCFNWVNYQTLNVVILRTTFSLVYNFLS